MRKLKKTVHYNSLELTGQRFGKLIALRREGRNKYCQIIWKCKCDCGNEVNVMAAKLKNGYTQSCGCLTKQRLRDLHFKHGLSKTRLYKKWKTIRNRCNNPNHDKYEYYGGRGIKVCERWDDFKNFYNDMYASYKQGLTVERIDPNGNYEPSNCKWDTCKNQARNKRNSKLITYKGETLCLAEMAEKYGIKYSLLYNRIMKGWDIHDAIKGKNKK